MIYASFSWIFSVQFFLLCRNYLFFNSNCYFKNSKGYISTIYVHTCILFKQDRWYATARVDRYKNAKARTLMNGEKDTRHAQKIMKFNMGWYLLVSMTRINLGRMSYLTLPRSIYKWWYFTKRFCLHFISFGCFFFFTFLIFSLVLLSTNSFLPVKDFSLSIFVWQINFSSSVDIITKTIWKFIFINWFKVCNNSS